MNRMHRIVPRLVLGIAGLLLLAIGAAVTIDPVAFAAANGVSLPDVPSVLSEYRAPGGMLLASAVLILVSVVRTTMLRTGLALAALVYGSYGAARLVGIVTDGMPSAALAQATGIELLMGSLCLVMLFTTRLRSGQR